jgi:hypothetical protein
MPFLVNKRSHCRNETSLHNDDYTSTLGLNSTFNENSHLSPSNIYKTIDHEPRNYKITLFTTIKKYNGNKRIIEIHRNANDMSMITITIKEPDTGATHNISLNCIDDNKLNC